MPKFLLPIICLLLLSAASTNAQSAFNTSYTENPFKKLQFNYGPTDTLTITATYFGKFGPLSEKNLSALEVIHKVKGFKDKNFKYSLGFTLDGYSQTFYMPCLDNSLYNALNAQQTAGKKLRLKCIVYRFYTIDGITNFFYVDKAAVIENSI